MRLPALVVVALAACSATAHASQLVTRNATGIRLAVSGGTALVTYQEAGSTRHLLVRGAINARRPTRRAPQVRFAVDYSGGLGTARREVWRSFGNTCLPYDGPPLAWLVSACKARDGSYWALQSWQRMLPGLGLAPWLPGQSAWDLRISHWRGELASLEVWRDWSHGGAFHHLFGRLTYHGVPVHGFASTPAGAPLDSYGRNLYLDTLDSAYGPGWRRENGFLAHRPSGIFCYGFFPHRPPAGSPPGGLRPGGHGKRYRLTVSGPGVTPDVMWSGTGLADFDRRNAGQVAYEQSMNALLDRLAEGDRLCHQH